MAPKQKRKVLVVGGQFTGGFTARELKKQFNVTVVDAKEYFEYTPGILRAFVKPAHFDALSFTLQPVFERKMGVKFIWGEVVHLALTGDNGGGVADIKPMFAPDGDMSLDATKKLKLAEADDERFNKQFEQYLGLITDQTLTEFKQQLQNKWDSAKKQSALASVWRTILDTYTQQLKEPNWKAGLTTRFNQWLATDALSSTEKDEAKKKWATIEKAKDFSQEMMDDFNLWYDVTAELHKAGPVNWPTPAEAVKSQFEVWAATSRLDEDVKKSMEEKWSSIIGGTRGDGENGEWKEWIDEFALSIKKHNEIRKKLPVWPGLPKVTEDLLQEYRNRAAGMKVDRIAWDFCVICSGCNFGPFNKWGESLWFPTIHTLAREQTMTNYAHIDERFIEGRRRHILEVYDSLCDLPKGTQMLVVGAGFIGVEWVTELQYFFPDLKLTICDFAPRCLGPLPEAGAEYCTEYMESVGIKQFYGKCAWNMDGYPAKLGGPEDWSLLELDRSDFYDKGSSVAKPNSIWVCIGVKASNHYMPTEVLSRDGPMGTSGWIHMNQYLQASRRPQQGFTLEDVLEPYGTKDESGKIRGNIFAVGDCNYGCIGEFQTGGPPNLAKMILPPIPKISYPGEEQAMHACVNLKIRDAQDNGGSACGCLFQPTKMKATWWPWGAGMFATSLGPHDACFIVAANENRGSGFMVNWWYPAAIQKEIIETTKVDEMKDNCIGILIWHFVHHTPVNCWGRGPCVPCQCCPIC